MTVSLRRIQDNGTQSRSLFKFRYHLSLSQATQKARKLTSKISLEQ